MRAGVLILLFVAYQLWGTGLATARAQDRLEREFTDQLAAVDATTSTTTSLAPDPSNPGTSSTTVDPAAPVELSPPAPGDPIARLTIPAIGVDFIVLEGVDLKWLKDGPGHFPQTPLPGQPGNAALAGHRTTYKAPFNRLDELKPGDEITVTTLQGTFTYRVDAHDVGAGDDPSGHFIVKPTQVEILDQDGPDRLTLVACHPKLSARERIVVTAALVTDPAPATPAVGRADPGTITGGDGSALPTDGAGVTTDASVDALAGGDSSAWGPAILWAALALMVWFATWYGARRWHRLPAYVVGTPVFLVVLFVAYENIARLLPAAF